MAQTSVSTTHSVAYEGSLGGQPKSVLAGRNNSGSEIPFGRVVVFDSGTGTSEMAIKLISASTDKFLGFLAISQDKEPTTTGLADDAIGNVVSQGQVWVIVEEAVTVGDAVCVRFQSAGSSPEAVGRLRNDTDSGDAVALPGVRFLTNAGAGEACLVEVNLP